MISFVSKYHLDFLVFGLSWSAVCNKSYLTITLPATDPSNGGMKNEERLITFPKLRSKHGRGKHTHVKFHHLQQFYRMWYKLYTTFRNALAYAYIIHVS